MDKQRTEKLYANILESLQVVKEEIAKELTNSIIYGYAIPASTSAELDQLSGATNKIFDILKGKGYEIGCVDDHEDLMQITLNGKAFVTKAMEDIGPAKPAKQKEVKETASFEGTTKEDTEKDDLSDEDDLEDLLKEEFPEDEEDFSDWAPGEDIEDETLPEKEETDESPEEETVEEEKKPEEPTRARIIGGDPIVKDVSKASLFVEEHRKKAEEFVFDTYRISVAHGESGGGGKGEEMYVMIAPLKIHRFACSSAPIIVSILYKGKVYSRSSYDALEDGKNLVTIDVNEFYFLCRGSFNSAGKFQSTIVTTGLSSDQGDILNCLRKESHGRGDVQNGHLKFRYDAEEGDGVVEVFPFGIEDDDFVIIAKNREFVDYLTVSNSQRGYSKAILYDGGIKKEVVCNWEDGMLEAELMEV